MSRIPYSSIDVSGADAAQFLQGQLTADLRPLGSGDHTLAAWCNPKGRVICIFRAQRGDDGFSLALPAELGETVAQRLAMYRFRAKVEFARRDTTLAELGASSDIDSWLHANLLAGRAEIWQAQSEKFTPHMLNLDLLGAVSFDKGCYTGQEVVARTHYRGATKRRCLRFSAGSAVQAGDKVSDGSRDIGEVVNAIGTDFLAVVPTASADDGLFVGGQAVNHEPLPYL